MEATTTAPTLPRVDRDATYLTNAPRGSKPFEAARLIPHTLLKPSPTNPRHWFDPEKMAELRESIKVHNVQQTLLVRLRDGDVPDGEPLYEVVDGERRWRNVCEIAGPGGAPVDLPCVVTDLSAEDAQEIQLLSAIQRADLHPVDEADGFEALLQDPPGKPKRARGFTIAELAARAGKSPRYVYSRLALCALQREARSAFYEGKVILSTAQALARLAPADQAEAVAHIVKGAPGGGPLPADEAQQHIQRSYMLRLSQATWLLHDETVLPAAGSCSMCTKRTGASPELFPDLSTPADTCTDRGCFQKKAAAARQRVIDAAKERGYEVISGDKARELLPSRTGPVKGHERLDEPCAMALSNKPLREVLGKKFASVVLIDHEAIGALVEAAPTAAVKRALQGLKLLREPEAKRTQAKPDRTSEPTPAPAPAQSSQPAPKPAAQPAAAAPAPAPAEPRHAPDDDLQVLAEVEDLPDRICGRLGSTPPSNADLRRMQREGSAIVRAILTACAIGRQMVNDGAEGLPAVERMLMTLLLHGSMHVSWPLAARIAAVKPAPESGGLRPLQAWAHTLGDEEVCRMVMVALALQEPTGDPDIERFPGQCVAALGTGVGYVPDEAARITRECIELQMVKHAPPAKKKAKAAAKGAAA